MLDKRWLIVGLGNPGSKYVRNFHNVGFMAIEYMVQKWGIPLNRNKFKASYGQGSHLGETVMLLQPETFMNLSGESVREAADYFKINPQQIIVIYDDLDLAMGEVRIRKKGSAGTHNGMKSIIAQLGTEDFLRIRIGIGPKPAQWDTIDYVLADIPEQHQDTIFQGLIATAEAIDLILEEDVDYAMNEIHRAQKKKQREERKARREQLLKEKRKAEEEAAATGSAESENDTNDRDN